MSQPFVCQICAEEILSNERIVRVAAEACDSEESMPDESFLLAVFHSECVVETFRSDDCDDVPYVDEAREVMLASPLCDCCKGKIAPAKRPRFKLLRGGLR